ncbi:MAG TPA: DegV family protein [Pseudogracilibacillus sp.]|nr:DegV family protein [Pseudogracilibacillus sp.]
MNIAVVSDSTGYIPDDLLKKYNIYTIPLSVVFGEESYREDIDITTEQFYKKIKETKDLPSTSQPSIGSFVQLFEQLSESYDAVISIHLSKRFSGTHDVAVSAGKMVDNLEVFAFDTALSAMPQGLFAIAASELATEGKTAEEIITCLEEMKEKTYAYFMVEDLSHLERGGRLNKGQALIGSLLNIKPVLHIVDGLIIPFEKIRTRKKALNRIMSMLENDVEKKEVKRVVFIHANNLTMAEKMEKEFSEKHPEVETIISHFGPVIGTHLGEGSLGVSWQIE